jgi:hypothetical protein
MRRAEASRSWRLLVGAMLVAAVPAVALALGKEANKVRRGDEPTRAQLEQQARRLGISGRSKMGKAQLKRAVARAKR